ncbi:MAG TPA: phosphatase PAP2 family protein [Solirubrobacterales bacterium]|nr:phosphatase PAP2 family protein [Solirubrobacterales bacterium]
MRSRSRPAKAVRPAVRAGAAALVGAAIALPLVRKRLRVPGPVTLAVAAAGPLAVAVLSPRTRRRDVALFTMQMWAFTVVHEMPYDDPEALRRRLYTGYPIKLDSLIGAGRLPGARLQNLLAGRRHTAALDRVLTITHWLWFFEPYAVLAWILVRHPRDFPRAARQMAAVFDVGALGYWALPTAPPWWSSEQGYTKEPLRRIMVEVGEPLWGRYWNPLYRALGGNPWAAMPSLHFATSLQAAISLTASSREEGAVAWAYALTLGFGLVYLGEHYVTDLLAGAGLVGAVRRADPVFAPAVGRISAVVQRLERIAGGGPR